MLVLGIVKASLKILGIGIGVRKVVLLMSAVGLFVNILFFAAWYFGCLQRLLL